MIGVTAFWGWALLNEDPTWLPWLRWVVLVGGLLAAAAVVVGSVPSLRGAVTVGVLAGTLFGLTGTTAYAIATTTVAHSGSIPRVGPAGAAAGGAGGGPGGDGGTGGFPGGQPGGTTSDSESGSGTQEGGMGTPPEGAPGAGTGAGTESGSGAESGTAPGAGTDSGTGTEGGSRTGGAGGMGGDGTTTSVALTKLLQSSDATWAAAVDGSQTAAQLELDSDQAVMAIGGWSSDPTPTLAEFEADVAAGRIGYYITSGSGAGGGTGGNGTSTASAIKDWVAANYTATTVGGSTVYDLSSTK
jgi:hypothetical protein